MSQRGEETEIQKKSKIKRSGGGRGGHVNSSGRRKGNEQKREGQREEEEELRRERGRERGRERYLQKQS